MKSPAWSGPRRKSQVDSSKPDPTGADTVATRSSNGSGTTDVHARISALAYKLYEQRGRRDGHDVEGRLMVAHQVFGKVASQVAEAQGSYSFKLLRSGPRGKEADKLSTNGGRACYRCSRPHC